MIEVQCLLVGLKPPIIRISRPIICSTKTIKLSGIPKIRITVLLPLLSKLPLNSLNFDFKLETTAAPIDTETPAFMSMETKFSAQSGRQKLRKRAQLSIKR